MNEGIILKMVSPFVKNGAITYEQFDHIFDMLSLREQYVVSELLFLNGILLVDEEEQRDERDNTESGEEENNQDVILDVDEEEENDENDEESLYDVSEYFKDSQTTGGEEHLLINRQIKQSNSILCALIQRGNKQAEQDLCIKNEKLVRKYAAAYHKCYGNRLDEDDLVQVGYIGLITAARRFDTSAGNAFSTYAVFWIKQAISREIINFGYVIRIPVHVVDRINKVSRAESHYSELDPSERIKKIAEELNTSEEYVRKCIVLRTNFMNYTSLNAPIGDDEKTELGEMIPEDGVKSVEERVEAQELKKVINEVLRTLSAREQQVIRLRYGLEDGRRRTLEDIGNIFNVTRERIRQIEQKAIRKLRHASRAKKLKDFVDWIGDQHE